MFPDVSYDFIRTNPKIIFVDKLQYQQTDDLPDYIPEDMEMAPSVVVLDSSKCMYSRHCFNYNALIVFMDQYYNEQKIRQFNCTELDMFRLKTLAIMYTRGISSPTKAVKIPHKVILSPIHKDVMSMLVDTVGMWMGPSFLFPNLILTIQSILLFKRTIIFEGNDIKKLCDAIKKYEVLHT